jgi:anti-anti-sigma factor
LQIIFGNTKIRGLLCLPPGEDLSSHGAETGTHQDYQTFAKEGLMSNGDGQIWGGSTFAIERKLGDPPGTVVFRFSGPFTGRDLYASLSPAALRKIFETDPTPDHHARFNILDLTDVPYMDSCGLGLIVSHFVRCQNLGVRVIAAGVSPRVLELLKTTRIDKLIPMAATVADASTLCHHKPL